MATAARRTSNNDSDDDGFGDFLSEDEEECALQTQEMAALERRMKTEGIRDGIDIGKEATLQRGFDDGFARGAAASYRFSVLRGALSAATACGLLATATQVQQDASAHVIAQLQHLEVQSAVGSSDSAVAQPPMASTTTAIDADAIVADAHRLLAELNINIPPALAAASAAGESTAS